MTTFQPHPPSDLVTQVRVREVFNFSFPLRVRVRPAARAHGDTYIRVRAEKKPQGALITAIRTGADSFPV